MAAKTVKSARKVSAKRDKKSIITTVSAYEQDKTAHDKQGTAHVKEPELAFAVDENKNQRLELRLTKRQKDIISKASSVSGFKNVSDYILHIAVSDSRNVIREQQIFELSERDRVSFMETLANPPAPGKNLKKARANYLSFKEGK